MGMQSFRSSRLETPAFPYSDLQLVVSGNNNNNNSLVCTETQPSSSLPLPMVKVPSPNPQPLNPILNPNNNTPQHRKRPNTGLNACHTQSHKSHVFEQQQQQQRDEEYRYECSDDGNDEEDEDEEIDEKEEHTEEGDEVEVEEEEEEEGSCSSSFLKNNKRRRKEKKLSTIDIASVKHLLDTVVTQQHRFFMDLLETLERNEQQRERIRADKEEKWRAEERAHRRIIDNAMILLTETLLREGCHHGRNGRDTLVGQFDRAREKSEKKKKRSKNWNRGEVLQLIRLRGEMKQRFSNTSRRGSLWDELAEALVSCGIKRDGKQCREKWDKLMASYKDVVDGKKEPADLPYFSELHSVVDSGNGGHEF